MDQSTPPAVIPTDIAPTAVDVGKTLEKVIEHIRQIHFLLLTVTLLLAYLTWAAYQDTPHVLGELERLELLLGKISAVRVFSGRTGPLTQPERQVLTELLATLNQHRLEVVREDFRNAIKRRLNAGSIADTVPSDDLLFASPPASMPALGTDDQATAVVFDHFNRLQLAVVVATDVEVGKNVQPPLAPADGYLFLSSMRNVEGDHAQFEIISKVRGEDTIARPIGNTGQVLTRPSYRVASTDLVEGAIRRSELTFMPEPGFVKKEFPALSGVSSSWRDYSPKRLRELVKSAGSHSLTSRSAKLFDIELQGRDISTVAAIVVFTGLLYFRSFAAQAVRLTTMCSPATRAGTLLARSIWIGTHEGLMHLLVGASLLASALVVTLGIWYFQGESYVVTATVGGPVVLACVAALVAMWRLRRVLGDGWVPVL